MNLNKSIEKFSKSKSYNKFVLCFQKQGRKWLYLLNVPDSHSHCIIGTIANAEIGTYVV